MRELLAFVLLLLSTASLAQNYPPVPEDSELVDPEIEKAKLGHPFGVWEGSVEPLYDPVGASRDQPGGYRMRLTIRQRSAEIIVFESDGEERRLGGEVYIYEVDNTVLISYVLATDGFVEYQSIALGQIERNKLKGFLSRLVHNLVVPNSSPWRLVPVYSQVTMERIQ